MRTGTPLWLIGAVAGLVLTVAGGIAWYREFAIADPKLAEFARDLLPAGAVIVRESGSHCQASNGWDRFYHPEDMCRELVFSLEGIPSGERLDLLAVKGSGQGWAIDRRTDTAIDLSRDGYTAFVRYLTDDQSERCREQARQSGETGDGCEGRLTIRAD